MSYWQDGSTLRTDRQSRGNRHQVLRGYASPGKGRRTEMRGKSMNRLAWAGGFTNDKQAHCNKEPYKKTCEKCKKQIWISPDAKGWRALNLDGSKHLCIVKNQSQKKKVNGVREIRRDCKFCGVPIVLIQLSGSGTKKYKAFEPLPPRTIHKCDRHTRSAYKRESKS